MSKTKLKKFKVKDILPPLPFEPPVGCLRLEDDQGTIVKIYIGLEEAIAINKALQDYVPSRPGIYETFLETLEVVGIKLEKLTIDKIVEGTFYALLHLSQNGKKYKKDIRPSDGINLALRAKAPIYVSDEVVKSTMCIDEEEQEFNSIVDILNHDMISPKGNIIIKRGPFPFDQDD